MKRCIGVALFVWMVGAMAVAADPPAYVKLQKLVGTWESKAPDGKVYVTEIKSMSAGSSLMMMQPDEGHGTMVTMIHPDGDRVLLTHYCSAKNQPRMVAEAMPDGKTIRFNFLDVTNVAKDQPGVMRSVTFTVADDDHMTQEWNFRTTDGKEMTDTFHMVRKK